MTDIADLGLCVTEFFDRLHRSISAELEMAISRSDGYGPVTISGAHSNWYDSSNLPGALWISDRANAHENTVPSGDVIHFRKDFFCDKQIEVVISTAADDGLQAMDLNGKALSAGNAASGGLTTRTAVTRKGWNVLHASVFNAGTSLTNPSAFLCHVAEQGAGGRVLAVSDGSWMRLGEPVLNDFNLHVNGKTDDVAFNWHQDTVLYSNKPFSFEIEYRYDTAATGMNAAAPILSLSRVNDTSNTGINRGVDVWARVSEGNILRVHVSGDSPWDGGNQVDLMRVQNIPSSSTFVNALDGRWHKIKVEYDGSEKPTGISITIDGIKQAVESTHIPNPTFANKVLSTPNAPIRFSAGTIPEVGTGKLIKGDTACTGWFRDVKLWKEGALVFHAPINEGRGSVIHDYSKYSNHSNPFTGAKWVV